jgi:hypothetical protein
MRASVLSLVLVSAAVAALDGQGAPTQASLELAHQTLTSALTSGSPALLEPMLHPRGLGFFRNSENIAQLGGDLSSGTAIPAVLADLSRFAAADYDTVYRVVGTTGVVCMATSLRPKKGEKGQPRYIRSTWMYVHVDGTWRLLSWHSSDVPLKK